MNEPVYLQVYLRLTNGIGELININSQLPSRLLHQLVSQIFNIHEAEIHIFLKGILLPSQGENTMENLGIHTASILHVQRKEDIEDERIEVRIFYQGLIYLYKTLKSSCFVDLKLELAETLNCKNQEILISYLGKIIDDQTTFLSQNIQNNDLISVYFEPSFQSAQPEVFKIKPKITESVTFTPSDQMETVEQPFTRELMRKSSMKSSEESREAFGRESKRFLQALRPKSHSASNIEQSMIENEAYGFLKDEYLNPFQNNRKVIETESINFDDPEIEEDPEQWQECKIELANKEMTKFYSIECNEIHTFASLLQTLSKCERKEKSEIKVIFGDENSQKLAEADKSILEIAKTSKTKIILNVIFE